MPARPDSTGAEDRSTNGPSPGGQTIALFLPNFAGGGAERAFLRLAGGLAAHGPVDIVVAGAGGPLVGEAPARVSVIDLGCSRVAAALLPLARYLREARPRALISGLTHANLVAIVAHSLARSRAALVVSEQLHFTAELEHALSLSARGTAVLMQLFYPRADRVVCVSAGVADDITRTARLRPRSVIVIYNPLPVADLRQLAAAPPDHPWFTAGAPPVVLAAGRLTPQKDFPTLLHAFSEVRDHTDARLVILGDGPERPRLERLVTDLGLGQTVDMPGFTKDPYPYFGAAALYALSSRWEGLPTVLIECLAIGLPIVATDCRSGPGEILKGGQLGTLVPVGDAAALGKAIVGALASPRPIPDDAVDPYRLERIAGEYLALVERLNPRGACGP